MKLLPFFGQLEHHQVPNYKASFDFRMRKKDGAYIRVLNQLKVIQFTDSKNILRALMLHTDISAIKTSGKPVLSFIGFNGEPSYIDVKATEKFPLPSQLLSDREREILALLIEGVESEAIAKELFISKETVNTHRRNILRKTGAANSAQLISKDEVVTQL